MPQDRKEEVQNDTYEGKEVMPDNPQYLPRHVQMETSRIFYKSSFCPQRRISRSALSHA